MGLSIILGFYLMRTIPGQELLSGLFPVRFVSAYIRPFGGALLAVLHLVSWWVLWKQRCTLLNLIDKKQQNTSTGVESDEGKNQAALGGGVRPVHSGCKASGDGVPPVQFGCNGSVEKDLQLLERTSFVQGMPGSHRPKRIILVRHGESEANLDRKITTVVPDHALHLTMLGRQQALEAGARLAHIIRSETVDFIASPYVRTRETLNGIAQAFGGVEQINIDFDVLIREMEYGNYDASNIQELHQERKEFGQFFYRFPEGESPSDVYLRASVFLFGLLQRFDRTRVTNMVLVSHGLFIMVLLMHLLRLSVDEFYALAQPHNCEMIVLELEQNGSGFYHVAYTQTYSGDIHPGVRTKPESAGAAVQADVWSGDPAEAGILSRPRKKGGKKDANRFATSM